MTSFFALLAWQLRAGVRRISTWVYFGIFFGIAFFMMQMLGGAWDLGGSLGKEVANSPSNVSAMLTTLLIFGVTVTAAIAGHSLHDDYASGVDQLLYSTPISKQDFLGARFTAAIILNLLVFSSLGLGLAIGAASPWVKPDHIASFDLAAYVGPYLSFVIPNVLLTSAIFFAIVALTRQMMPVYVGGVALLIGYSIAGVLIGDIDNKQIAALVDPFGVHAQRLVTQYWSIVEQNTQHIPFSGVIAANRVIWLSVAFAIFAWGFRRFKFAHVAEHEGRVVAAPDAPMRPIAVPEVTQHFDLRARLVQFRSVFTGSFLRLVRNKYFAILLAIGLFFLGVSAREAGALYGTPTWPVTYHMEEILQGTIGIFMIVLTAIYSGELVWAERDTRSSQISDSTPVTTVVLFLGKLAALCAVIALILCVMMVAGIVAQSLMGYFNYQVPLYLQALFGFRFADMVMFAVLAMLVHTVSNHKYVGHLLVIVLFVAIGLLQVFGLERGFYLFSYDPGAVYSDMNGWGPYVRPFIWWKAYWLSFCVIILVATTLLWVRGEETHLRWRARLARSRFRGSARRVAGAAALAMAGVGGFLYYNTDVLNIFRTGKENRRLLAEREKSYKKFQDAPQPRVTRAKVRVDIEPRRGSVAVTGEYVLRNKTRSLIDTIHLTLGEDMAIGGITFDGAGEHIVSDSVRDYHAYRLPRPLAPGDSTIMRFELRHQKRGIPHDVQVLWLAENGSFMHSQTFLPQIGYNDQLELSDDDARKKEKLKPKERMRPPTDSTTWRNNYISTDSDWIDFEATISTDEDQIALAPGYLQREWVEGGRRVFRYEMDTPILNMWALLSARYAVRRDRWNPSLRSGQAIDISIFYHPEHTYNVDRMITGVKRSLDYFTEQFGPYQHRQIRIAEFPRYAGFAQSLPNLIPYSEAVGFIARIRNKDDIDYPFHVTAHEIAHAWWAHQVVGAEAQGATMLSETLAEYSALMVMEKEYGARNMRRFLEYEMDDYLMGRATERRREMPLELVENQPYIHYNKGAVAMYALRDYIGEARVNGALKRFLDATKFKGPPYPTSLQLVKELRDATPDSLKYLITDLFETITLYELRTDSAIVRKASADTSKFEVELFLSAKKQRADSTGRTRDIAMRDWVDVGVFAKPTGDSAKAYDRNGIPLYLMKQRIDSGDQRVRIMVDRMPSRAGIDPLHKLVDRFLLNNTVAVKDRTAPNPSATRSVRKATP